MASDMWTYRGETDLGVDVARGVDITGYGVEALDDSIGKIDEATYDVGASYIVVDTGPWIFGKKVMLPAGVIDRIDTEEETVYVNRSKDEIKKAPELDETAYHEETYRKQLGGYYGLGGAGHREGTPRRGSISELAQLFVAAQKGLWTASPFC